MTESSPDAPRPSRAMPREAIRAIAYSGHFCGVTAAFMAYFAWRMGFHPGWIGLNALTAAFMFAGSAWMLAQLKRP